MIPDVDVNNAWLCQALFTFQWRLAAFAVCMCRITDVWQRTLLDDAAMLAYRRLWKPFLVSIKKFIDH
jgi:hypothetical protein